MIFILSPENPKVEKNLQAYLSQLPPGKWEVLIKKPGKTSSQRNFFHFLCDIVSDHTGESKELVKMRHKFKNLPLETVHIEGLGMMLFPISSEDTTKEQYGKLIDSVTEEGLGLDLIMPAAWAHGVER